MYLEDTIVAPATPPGTGAVAIVRLSGKNAIAILEKLWRPATKRAVAARELQLGNIVDPQTGATVDRVLAVTMPAPRSLTGEDVAEIHCHGGQYIVRRIVALAIRAGARMAEAGEFSRRAFLNGRMDLTEAEAVADLVAARSESALAQALSQLSGGLAERITAIRSELIALRAHLEAEIDFSDEDLNLPSSAELMFHLDRTMGDVAILHDSFARGRLMRDGARAVIIGKPNVGKSSVLNLVLGVERAIVTPIPGTTRDVIEDSIHLGPYQLVLQDTAGVRESADQVERIGIERTLKSVGDADLVIAVFDSSRPFDDQDDAVLRLCDGRPGIALLNKRDCQPAFSTDQLLGAGVSNPILPLCALDPTDAVPLKDELRSVIESLSGERAGEGIAISRERHRDSLATALRAMRAAAESLACGMPPEIVAVDVMAAADALGAITGEVATEDVLDAVFRQFCIGK
ncbi:MAG: tRNA uridine-5-carboxymethylaminomethyl(34) synthesis GTPase MnmE [Candidatus Binataceae bacterium]